MQPPSSAAQKSTEPPQPAAATLSMSIADLVLNPKSYSALLEAESGSRAASETESEEQTRSLIGETRTTEPRPSTHRAPPPPPPATSIADLVLDNTIYDTLLTSSRLTAENPTLLPSGTSPTPPPPPRAVTDDAATATSGAPKQSFLPAGFFPGPGPIKASLGEATVFTYDEVARRWVSKKVRRPVLSRLLGKTSLS